MFAMAAAGSDPHTGRDDAVHAPNYQSGTTGKLGRKTAAAQRVESPESNWQAKDTGMEEQELAELMDELAGGRKTPPPLYRGRKAGVGGGV